MESVCSAIELRTANHCNTAHPPIVMVALHCTAPSPCHSVCLKNLSQFSVSVTLRAIQLFLIPDYISSC